MFILCIYHVSKLIYTIQNLGIAASRNFGERTAGTLSRALGAHGTDWVRMTMENGEDVIVKTGSATEIHENSTMSYMNCKFSKFQSVLRNETLMVRSKGLMKLPR